MQKNICETLNYRKDRSVNFTIQFSRENYLLFAKEVTVKNNFKLLLLVLVSSIQKHFKVESHK